MKRFYSVLFAVIGLLLLSCEDGRVRFPADQDASGQVDDEGDMTENAENDIDVSTNTDNGTDLEEIGDDQDGDGVESEEPVSDTDIFLPSCKGHANLVQCDDNNDLSFDDLCFDEACVGQDWRLGETCADDEDCNGETYCAIRREDTSGSCRLMRSMGFSRDSDLNHPHQTSFTTDGTLLAVSDGRFVRVFDTARWETIRTFSGHDEWGVNGLAFSHDGRMMAVANGASLKIWRISDGKKIFDRQGSDGTYLTVAFSPDDAFLAAGNTGKIVKLIFIPTGDESTLSGHAAPVTGVAFSPDGKLIASGSRDGDVKLWDMATGTEAHALAGHTLAVTAVAFSPDGTMVASAACAEEALPCLRGEWRLWSVASGAEQNSFTDTSGSMNAIAFAPTSDDVLLAWAGCSQWSLGGTCQGSEVRYLTLNGGSLGLLASGHTDAIFSFAFSAEGALLATASNDGTLRLWDAESHQEIRHSAGHLGSANGVAVSPDSTTIATAGDDGLVKLWKSTDGTLLRSLAGHTDTVSTVAFSPDGTMLASGGADWDIKLWRYADGGELRTLSRHTGRVSTVVFSPDGTTLASGGSDNMIRLWRLSDGTETRILSDPNMTDVAELFFSPDGAVLASMSGDGFPRLWKVADGTLIGTISYGDGSAFSHDLSLYARLENEHTISIHRASNDLQMGTLYSAGTVGRPIAFSHDDRFLVSLDVDTIRVWRFSDGQEVRSIQRAAYLFSSLIFSPDDKKLVGTDLDSHIYWWDVSDLTQ